MFNNTGHVLKWAYDTVTRPIVKMSGVHQMRHTAMRGLPNELLLGLNAQDRHKQAAEIIGMVDRLSDPAAREYIGGKFGCRVEEKELRMLTYRCSSHLGMEFGGGHAVYLILKTYFFGGKLPYRTVRQILGCRNQYALTVRSCLHDVLDLIHDRAMAELEESFERHGLICRGSGVRS